MKRFLIVLVMLLLSSNAFAKAYKVKLLEENIYGTVFKITMPNYSRENVYPWNKAFQKAIDIANNNCERYNKKTFTFWSQISGWFSRDENGNLNPSLTKLTWGYVQDMDRFWHLRIRYFCGENIEEAFEVFNNYDNYFKKKFNNSKYLNLETILYSEISDDPFHFKNIDGTDATFVSKPKTVAEVAQKEQEDKKFEKIEGYKKTCSALGFELGTDKFTDCTLKLYVADNKETAQIVQSSSGAQEMIIYDPDRERRIQQKAWNDLLHGRCSLNALSKNPC